MIIWCDKDELFISSNKEPQTAVRKPLPSDTPEEKKDKRKKPYLNKVDVCFYINYLGSEYPVYIPKGYTWDGSSCPGFHHLPSLLNASMVHDVLCEEHRILRGDRQLSSIIFREIGIASGVNKAFIYLAYYAVDNYQKFFGKDKEGNKWH